MGVKKILLSVAEIVGNSKPLLINPEEGKFKNRVRFQFKEFFDEPPYLEKMVKLSEKDVDEIYYNNNPDHTNIILSLMMKKSDNNDTLVLYEGGISGDLLNRKNEIDLLSEFKAFTTEKHGTVEIIIDNGGEKKLDVIDQLTSALGDKVKLFELKKAVNLKNGKRIVTMPHFAANKKAYRLENHKYTSATEREATGNFNNPNAANTLKNIFEDMKANSVPVWTSLVVS